MKKNLKAVFVLFMTCAVLLSESLAAFVSEAANEEKTVTDIENLDASEWMAAIPDEAYLSAMNVPGTHDSGLSLSATGFGKFSQCQTLTITEQLEAGIRFFDLRLRYGGDPEDVGTSKEIKSLYVCHGQGVVCCDGYIMVPDGKGGEDKVNYTYEMVLDEMASFLEAHPSETIFYFVRNEYLTDEEKKATTGSAKKENDCFKNVLAYDDELMKARFEKSPVNAETGEHTHEFVILTPDATAGGQYTEFYKKTMDECRGKLFRFQNEYGFGSMMNGALFNDWDSSYNDKWDVIKPYFDAAPVQTLRVAKTRKYGDAAGEKRNPDTFRAAWTSCTGLYTYDETGKRTWNNFGVETVDIFDWFHNGVGFPTGGDEGEMMRPLLMGYEYDWGAYYGWIGMDMVTADLARLIFQTNDFNLQETVISKKIPTYIKDIEGFCDVSYDDAVQRCYAKGFTPVPSRVNPNGRVSYDVNPDGYPIVIGYTTTTDPKAAITDIVGRYDSNEPGGYTKVPVNNSIYNRFTRGSDWSSENTYLFVSRSLSKAPIKEVKLVWDDDPGVKNGMVSLDFDGDIPVGSKVTFNIQQGVSMDGKNLVVGLQMIRDESVNKYGTIFGSGSIWIMLGCILILVLGVLLMLEIRKNRKLSVQLKEMQKANGQVPVATGTEEEKK